MVRRQSFGNNREEAGLLRERVAEKSRLQKSLAMLVIELPDLRASNGRLQENIKNVLRVKKRSNAGERRWR